jgi:hypothetical protein
MRASPNTAVALAAALSLCAACPGTNSFDTDGDGTADDIDCAPEDPEIHPAADEDCGDGVDNDCNGDIDGDDAACQGDDDVADDDETSDDDDSASPDDDDSSLPDDDDSAVADDDDSTPPDLPDEWIEFEPAGDALPALRDADAVFDPVQHRILVVGGQGHYALLDAVWAFDWADAGNLTLLMTEAPPAPRAGHRMAVDLDRERLLLVGGQGHYDLYADVHALDLSSAEGGWSKLTPGGPPLPPRSGHVAVFDEGGDRLLVFGGQGHYELLDDLWALDFTASDDGEWIELLPSGDAPTPRAGAGGAWDPATGRLYVGGGQGLYELPEDLHALDLGVGGDGTWTTLTPTAGAPVAAAGAGWTWDPWLQRLVQVGGQGHYELLLAPQEVGFASSVDGEWNAITPSSGPPAERRGTAAAFVPEDNLVVVFGGAGLHGLLDDIWGLQF